MKEQNTASNMELKNWHHEVIDISKECLFVENPRMSVLANSVELLNSAFLRTLEPHHKVLEIGCGSYSLIRECMVSAANWEGIDVVDFDRKGNRSIATKKASVENIPFPDKSFDYVLSNQSIEHWHEYGVDICEGLLEIRRVLKETGVAVINFPIHLHGHRYFVLGGFDSIDKQFEVSGLRIVKKVAVIKSERPAYKGWRMCGFPDFFIRRDARHENTSYIVEYMATRSADMVLPNGAIRKRKNLSVLQRHLHYGWLYLVWKVAARLLSKDRVSASSTGSL